MMKVRLIRNATMVIEYAGLGGRYPHSGSTCSQSTHSGPSRVLAEDDPGNRAANEVLRPRIIDFRNSWSSSPFKVRHRLIRSPHFGHSRGSTFQTL